MLAKIRAALSAVGGLQVIAATLAIGWGLGKLAEVAEQRQAACDALAAELAELEGDLAAAVARHPASFTPPCDPHADRTPYPAPEDLAPLAAESATEPDRG